MQLADRLGLSSDEIAGLESGSINAAPQLRLILMSYFGCKFEDLFNVLTVNLDEDCGKSTDDHDPRAVQFLS